MVGRGEFMDIHEAWVKGKSRCSSSNRGGLRRQAEEVALVVAIGVRAGSASFKERLCPDHQSHRDHGGEED